MDRVSFVVDVSREDLEDLAMNLAGVQIDGNVSGADLASLLKTAITAGLQEYLGETEGVNVRAQ